jgi:KaiC/GvpD/RAD55 family RecA-like ATPase
MRINMSDNNTKTGLNKLPYETMAETAEKPDLEFLIEGLIPEKGVAMIFGASSVGKSFVTLSLALHLAYGVPWNGVKQEPKNILYVVAEGSAGMKAREAGWMRKNGIQKYTDRFLKITQPVDLVTENGQYLVLIDDAMTREQETGRKTDLVIFDTLSPCMAGADENSTAALSTVVKHAHFIAQTLNCAVLLIHHTGKDETKGARGAYALTCNVDASIYVTRVSDKVLSLENQKMRDDAKQTMAVNIEKILLPNLSRKRTTGEMRSTLVVSEFTGDPIPNDEEGGKETKLALAIAQGIEMNQNWSLFSVCERLKKNGYKISGNAEGYKKLRSYLPEGQPHRVKISDTESRDVTYIVGGRDSKGRLNNEVIRVTKADID